MPVMTCSKNGQLGYCLANSAAESISLTDSANDTARLAIPLTKQLSVSKHPKVSVILTLHSFIFFDPHVSLEYLLLLRCPLKKRFSLLLISIFRRQDKLCRYVTNRSRL